CQENWINQQNIALGVLHLIGEHSKWSRSLDTIGFPSIFDTLLSRIQVSDKFTNLDKILQKQDFFASMANIILNAPK
ncbi:hypothetical protein, partial [Geobacillus sp.]|uniref:hypothetical protein n=1 Tax=Geobacillus sp. TaxID=1891658 RepID=UPI00257F6F38